MAARQYPTIWHLQSAQLNMLNWQIHQQQQLATWQSNLHQALHDTEQNARRVALTIGPDLFAAAVLSRSWMLRVAGMGAQSFNDFHAKRAWSDAIGILDGAARAAANDGRVAQMVDGYMHLVDTLAGYHRRMGGEAQPYIDDFRRRFNATRQGTPFYIGAGVAMVLSLICWFATGLAALGTLCFVGAGGAIYFGFRADKRRANAQRELQAAEGYANEYLAFQTDPTRGQWLQEVWRDHRFLFEVPIPDGPPSSQHAQGPAQMFVERKIVERQVVVTRCKFCKKLTPVDLQACEHCGAPGYGS